jgi:hypothetical protein
MLCGFRGLVRSERMVLVNNPDIDPARLILALVAPFPFPAAVAVSLLSRSFASLTALITVVVASRAALALTSTAMKSTSASVLSALGVDRPNIALAFAVRKAMITPDPVPTSNTSGVTPRLKRCCSHVVCAGEERVSMSKKLSSAGS